MYISRLLTQSGFLCLLMFHVKHFVKLFKSIFIYPCLSNKQFISLLYQNNHKKLRKMKTTTPTTENVIALYEGSYQFNVIKTHLNISPDFAQMKLAQQYEYRPTTESLWAEITVNGETKRYVLDYNNNLLNEIVFK